ncbi:MAG TPA: PQQ-binding-like beta-propeller repeat protein [Polyangiales bacterium]|nr:PQQ-binding-like beta-propeller repeat protein [Polyangiales bacterium]
MGCSDDDASRPRKNDGSVEENAGDAASPQKPDSGGHDTTGPVTPSPRWTMMGYDNLNNYVQPHEKKLKVDNAKELKEHWRIQTSGFPAGSPVIVDGKVYISATGGMVAVDLDTGKELWTQPMVRGTATPAYHEGFLYMHAASGAKLYKLDAEDGSIVWGPIATYPQNEACDGTSSPVVAGDLIIVGHSCGGAEVGGGTAQAAAKGGVEALRMEDGSHAWTYWTVPEEGETGAMVWSTVAVDLDAKVVFATTGNNYTVAGGNSDAFHAIDLMTGERKWVKQVREGDLWSLDSMRMVFGTGEDTDFGANPILAEVDGRKVVAAGDKAGSFWMLDRETGEIIWKHEKLTPSFRANTGGVLMNGAWDGKYFYVVSNDPANMPPDALLHVLNPKDGEDVREPKRLDGLTWGAPSLANGLLLVPVNSKLLVLDAESLDELAQFETGGTIASGAAAIVDGRIVVKSGLQYGFGVELKDNHEVVSFGLGEPEGTGIVGEKESGNAADKDTFTAVYDDVIAGAGCAGSPLCHAGEAGKLTMKDRDSTYKALVDVKAMGKNEPGSSSENCADSDLARVVPGKPAESLLLLKLEGTQPCGDQMPIGNKLSDEQISQVRAWIEHGAKDN